jgi:single-strand DNA-binding protein
MLNQVILVGRLAREVETKELEGGKKKAYITLACPRSYKNADGLYDTDFIDITLWDGIATNTAEYCHKGDIIGIKGRLQTSTYEKEDGTKEYKKEIVAEKVTFLSSKKASEEDE